MRRRPALAVGFIGGVCAIIIGVAFVWGRRLQGVHPEVNLGAAPFVGRWKWRPSLHVLPAVVLGVAVVVVGPSVARRLRFGMLAVGSAISAAAFALLLAAADGGAAVLAPVVNPTEYFASVAKLPPAGDILRQYGTRKFLVNYSPHLKGHPPGFVLILKAMRFIGLDKPWQAGALSFLGVAMMVAAVLVAVRTVIDRNAATMLAPFLVLAPFAVWLGTSADAFFTGVFATGVALAAIAGRAPTLVRGVGVATVAGATLAGTMYLTYGATTLLPLPFVLLIGGVGRSWSSWLVRTISCGLGALAVFVLFGHFGFSWFDGLRTTRGLYWEGTAKFRPWTYFVVGNIVVLLIAVGPAVVASWAVVSRVDRNEVTRWLLVLPAMLGIAVANASQLSKGEVERIWLLFMPWLLSATVSLRRTRWWLAAQLTTAVLLQTWLVSKW